MHDVILFGEPMALFVANDVGSLEDVNNYTRSVSGAEVNVAIGLRRLGHHVAYISRVGEDTLGDYIVNTLKRHDIDTQYISRDSNYKTGIQLKSKVLEGDAIAPYFRKESAATKINLDILESVDFTNVRLLHITGIPLALSESFRDLIRVAIIKAKENNVTITFDPNIRKELWSSDAVCRLTILEIAKQCDYFLPGLNEIEFLTKLTDVNTAYDYFHNLGVKNMIVKAGSNGSFYYDDGQLNQVPRFNVDQVVDTVGAGDGFAAGFIYSILAGLPMRDCVKNANAVGAIQVGHWSDNEGLPTQSELEAFIQRSKHEEY